MNKEKGIETKEWLKRGWRIEKQIIQIREAKNNAFEMSLKTSSEPTDYDRVQSSCENATEDRFVDYADYSILLDEIIEEQYKIKGEILKVINKVQKGIYKELLYARYINFHTWDKIANEMGYKDVRHIYRIHNNALSAVEEIRKKKFFNKFI